MRITILLVGITAFSAPAADHTADTLHAVKKSVADGTAVLLDVREQEEWDAGHLKAAKLLPLSSLKGAPNADAVAKVAPKDKVVYCHCASGVRSVKAADALKKLGYDARPLKAGYADLVKAGFPAAK